MTSTAAASSFLSPTRASEGRDSLSANPRCTGDQTTTEGNGREAGTLKGAAQSTNTCKGRHYFQSNLLTIFKASQKYPSFIKFRKMFIVSQKVFLTACKSAFVFLRVDQHSCLSHYSHLSHYHTSSKKQSLASTKQSLSFIFILISSPAFS